MVYDGTTYGNQTVGLRFTNLNIPQGSTITKAYIQFTCDEVKTGATSVSIKGEAADNSAVFTTASKNVSNRTNTTETVAWTNIPSWNTVGAATANERTPELKTIVQEIVNRSGFTTSSAMSFIITGTGTRTAVAYEGSASQAPMLYIEYTTNSIITSVTELIPENVEIVAFPNPFTNEFELKIDNDLITNGTVELYNMQGQLLYTSLIADQQTIKLGADLNEGVYICKLKIREQVKILKLIKM